MPSLAITQPYAVKKLDLIDATDRSYRQIESAWASAIQIQKALQDLTNVNSTTGLAQAGSYFMPSSISAANRATYEMYINFLIGTFPAVIAGTLDVDTVTFTPTVSPAWPVNILSKLFDLKSYAVATYDVTNSGTYLVTPIASNTATTVVSVAACFTAADRIVLVPKAVAPTDVLSWIMDLS